jgi:hypothetical protein
MESDQSEPEISEKTSAVPEETTRKVRGRKRREPIEPPAKEKRRGPGRPPTRPPIPPVVKYGIVDSPKCSEHNIEFVFEEPMIFKSIFAYFKNLHTHDIYMRCNKEGLTLFAWDHSKASRVVIKFKGSNSILWFCDKETWIGLNRAFVEKIFASIDKSFSTISIYQDTESPDSITISFEDSEIKKECNYCIKTTHLERDDELRSAELLTSADMKYKIEFTLTSKQFKKSVLDAINYTGTITYDKIDGYPLRLMHNRVEMDFSEIYNDAEKIKLKTNLKEHEHFQCDVRLANIKSLATSMVTDNVCIACDGDNYMMLRSLFENQSVSVDTIVDIRSEFTE